MSDGEDNISDSGSAIDDTPADGARRSGENPYVNDEYRRRTQNHAGGWYKPYNLSDEFATEISTERIDLESCLKGSELASICKAYNAYEEKHGNHYVKNGRRNVPPGMIDYFLQTSGKFEGGENTYLMIAQGNKVTIRQNKGQGMHIVTPFGVKDNKIFFPKGLVWSQTSIKDDKKLPFSIESITPLQGKDFPAIDMFKEIAAKTARPKYELTEDEYKKVFCLIARFRGTQGSYSSKYNFELYSFCSRPADNAADLNRKYLITHGWFSDEKRQLTELLLKDKRHFCVDDKNTYDFKRLYEAVHKPKTTTRKRKAQEDSGEKEFEVAKDEDNRYLVINVDACRFVSWNSVIKNMLNAQKEKITPKSEEEYWESLFAYHSDWTQAEQDKAKAEFEEKVQTAMNAKDKPCKDMESARVLVMKEHMIKHLVTPERLQVDYIESEHPMTLAVSADEDARNATIEIVRQMVCTALVITVKESGIILINTTPKMKKTYFDSRFMKPLYEAGILATSADDKVIKNIIRLEDAMNQVIGAVSMRPGGKDIAMHISIMQENLGVIVDDLLENEYPAMRRWVSNIIECTIIRDEEEEQFNSVWLPSILSAMVLFFVRNMCKMVEENKLNEIPASITCHNAIPEWKIPSKRESLSRVCDSICSWNDFVEMENIKSKFNLDDDKLESIDMNDMITGRNRVLLLESKDENQMIMIRHITKDLNSDGTFQLNVVNFNYKFSPYPVFSECDQMRLLFQQLGNEEAVEKHPQVHWLHQVVKNIFDDTIGKKKEFVQVPVKSSIRDPARWTQLKSDCFDVSDEETTRFMGKAKSLLIGSVLKDLAIATNLILNDALKNTGVVDWSNIITPKTTTICRRCLNETTGEDELFLQLKEFVRQMLVNIGKASFAAQEKGVTLIGQSIVNDDIRGMVYVLSLNTIDQIKDDAPPELQYMTQRAALGNIFYIPIFEDADHEEREQDTQNEALFIHPDIIGAEKMEPMCPAAASAIKELQAREED